MKGRSFNIDPVVAGCLHLYLELSYGDRDTKDREDGWNVVECLDTDIARMAAEPNIAAEMASVFEPSPLAAPLGIAIARYCFSGRHPTTGLMAGPHATEVEEILHWASEGEVLSHERRRDMYDHNRDARQTLENMFAEPGQLEAAILDPSRDGEIAPLLAQLMGVDLTREKDDLAVYRWLVSTRLTMLFKTNSIRVLRRDLIAGFTGGFVPTDDEIRARSFHWLDAMEPQGRHSLGGADDDHVGSGRVFVTLQWNEDGKTKSRQVERRIYRDALVLATLALLNEYAYRLGLTTRYVLITGTWRILRAAAKVEAWQGFGTGSHFVRRPICMLGQLVHKEKGGSSWLGPLRAELSRFVEDLFGKSGLPIDRAVRSALYGTRQSARALLLEELSHRSLHEVEIRYRIEKEFSGLLGSQAWRESLRAMVSSKETRTYVITPATWRETTLGILNRFDRERIAGLVTWLSMDTFDLTPDSPPPPRRTPVLRLGTYRIAANYAAALRRTSNPRRFLAESLARLLEQVGKEDPTKYSLLLINALALASVGLWGQARDLAVYATRVPLEEPRRDAAGETPIPTNLLPGRELIDGREAFYLAAFLWRYRAKDESMLDQCGEWLEKAFPLVMGAEESREADHVIRALRVGDIANAVRLHPPGDLRILSEYCSLLLAKQSWRRFPKMDRLRSPSDLATALAHLLDGLLALSARISVAPTGNGLNLTAELDYLRDQTYTNTMMAALMLRCEPDGRERVAQQASQLATVANQYNAHLTNLSRSRTHSDYLGFVNALSTIAFLGGAALSPAEIELLRVQAQQYCQRSDLVPLYEKSRARVLVEQIFGSDTVCKSIHDFRST